MTLGVYAGIEMVDGTGYKHPIKIMVNYQYVDTK